MLPFELTKDTPYLALSGELWSVFHEYFTEIDRVIKGFYCNRCELTHWGSTQDWLQLWWWMITLGYLLTHQPLRDVEVILWVIFKFILLVDIMSTSSKIDLRWVPQNPIDKYTLVQVMAWCNQATNQYLSQCSPWYMSPYGIIWPRWVQVPIGWVIDWLTDNKVFNC